MTIKSSMCFLFVVVNTYLSLRQQLFGQLFFFSLKFEVTFSNHHNVYIYICIYLFFVKRFSVMILPPQRRCKFKCLKKLKIKFSRPVLQHIMYRITFQFIMVFSFYSVVYNVVFTSESKKKCYINK